MTGLQIVFLVVATIILAAAVQVVSTRNLVHAALWLIVTLFGMAILFVLLEAGFLAVVQVVVYIGAISILIIFAIMLTRRVMQDTGPQTNNQWWLGGLLAAAEAGRLAFAEVSVTPQIAEGLSPMNPIALARLLLVEALYRAVSLEANHPYHRE